MAKYVPFLTVVPFPCNKKSLRQEEKPKGLMGRAVTIPRGGRNDDRKRNRIRFRSARFTFISDYSTLPAFYQHFGANCRFFCTISMSPDSSALFPSRTLPEALPLDSAKGSSTLWTPVRAIQLVTLSCYARVLIGGTQGRCPWTPVRAIQLVTLSCYVRVLIR